MSFRIPTATYRLQFNGQFTFQQATAIAGYLNELGVSDCYASPLFKATEHSTHGYDICDFGQLNPNLGTTKDFDRFTARLHELQMGLILDMVPNHMSTDLGNSWWWDVLENGRESSYSGWFDIDWERLENRGKVLLPVLEAPYAEVLEAGKLSLCFEPHPEHASSAQIGKAVRGRFLLAYHERRFPLSAVSSARLFSRLEEQPSVEALLNEYNGKPGSPDSFGLLDSLVDEQHYRLACWQVGAYELNYRRFFDVTELASLRIELPEVFQATHQLLFRLIQERRFTGLRVDHPDGLWNPKQYFQRLQQCCSMQVGGSVETECYIVAEKILMAGEALPHDWPIAGTTGYEFLNCVNGLFVASENLNSLSQSYNDFIQSQQTFPEVVRSAKQRILNHALCSELRTLAARLKQIASQTRYGQDLTSQELEQGLTEFIVCFPVYRTYVTEETIEPEKTEQEHIHKAAELAVGLGPAKLTPALKFITHLLLLRFPADLDADDRQLARDFVMRFQQLTGPVMAKGLEDTAFYVFNRLVSLNEVGGGPERFGVSVETFHEINHTRHERWPHSILATATHDTKRGEDVRARINVLSEMPEEWPSAVRQWRALNLQHKTLQEGEPAPSANDEYLLYQILIGSWPTAAEAGYSARVKAYMQKATREAKTHTGWAAPNAAYEDATSQFVERILSDSASNEFLKQFRVFQKTVAFFGQFNSLSQALLKTTSPGVPDFYQGTELWELSLVDPDNRRPVDYDLRQRQLHELKKHWEESDKPAKKFLATLLDESSTGMMKLFVIWRALNFRRTQRELFSRGDYIPLKVQGAKERHLCAFARRFGQKEVVVIAPRLLLTLAQGVQRAPLGELWKDTVMELPGSTAAGRYENVFTGETIKPSGAVLGLREVFTLFPVALLERVD